jgi:hypothetical protein
MLTVGNLLEVVDGLDPDAQVVVGIIDGPAYAEQQVRGTAVSLGPDRHELRGQAPVLYVCCYEQPRPWEGPEPGISDDGDPILKYHPERDEPPKADPDPPAGRAAA